MVNPMQGFLMERGERYEAYAELRERKLRMKYLRQQEYEAKVVTPPRKKQVRFDSGRKGSSLVAQSVPDFSAALRKENRKPVTNNMLPPLTELTPPSARRGCGGGGGGGVGLLKPRKSYATIHELKSLSSATANDINGESSRVITTKPVLRYTHI